MGKWAAGILLVLLFTGIVGRLLLKTDMVLNFIKATVIRQANGQLDARLSIEEITGDAATRLVWHDVALIHQDDTVAALDSLVLDYSLWPLWSSELFVEELTLSGPTLSVRQRADGTWNLEQLLPPVDSSDKQIDSTKKTDPFPFRITINNIGLNNGAISINSSALPDSSLLFEQIEALGSFVSDDTYRAGLKDLQFTITGEPIGKTTVDASALASDATYNLEKLLINTGLSMLRLSGNYQTESGNISAEMLADPLSWQDLKAYSNEIPLKNDLKANVSLQGRWPDLNLGISAHANGLDTLQWDTGFSMDSLITIHQSTLFAQGINLNTLADTTGLPVIDELTADVVGRIYLNEPMLSRLRGSWKASRIQHEVASSDILSGEVALNNRSLHLKARADRAGEQWKAEVNAPELSATAGQTSWRAVLTGRQVDTGFWMDDERAAGSLNLTLNVEGTGIEPTGQEPWNYAIQATQIEVGGQQVREVATTGRLTNENLTLNGKMQIDTSSIAYNGRYNWSTSMPVYQLKLEAGDFNLAEINGLEDLSTSLTGRINIDGKGLSLGTMGASATIEMDTSYVNGALISNVLGNIALSDSVLYLRNGALNSEIAEGQLSARLNTLKYYDLENRLDLEAEIKNITSLAPLIGVTKLSGSGNLFGTLQPDSAGTLRYTGQTTLHNLQIGESGTIDSLIANANAKVGEVITYGLNVRVKRPAYSEITLNNTDFSANGRYSESKTEGQFELGFHSLGTQSVHQEGMYMLTPDSLRIRTDQLSVMGGQEQLTLVETFDITINNEKMRIEQLQLRSQGGSSLKIALPTYSKQALSFTASAQYLNLVDVQTALLDDVFIKGNAHFDLSVGQSGDSLNVRFANKIGAFSIPGLISLDTLNTSAVIENGQLRADLLAMKDSTLWADGFIDIPFQLGDPSNFEQTFFEQPVSGRISIPEKKLSEFQGLLPRLGLAETTGNLGFAARLAGTASLPEMSANLNITPLVTSGVRLDSVLTDFNYNHSDQKLIINSRINSLSQKMAVLTARFPLHIDLKNATVNPPQPADSIDGTIITNNFSMAAVNDFADPKLLRDITGTLNGGITIEGTLALPEIMGSLQLEKGKFQMVPAGMTYQAINSKLVFKGDEVQLANFSMQADRGTLTANGSVKLDDLIPDEVDIRVKAKTFKLANTRDLSLNISADSKIGGSLTQPEISGSITINNGFYYLQNFGEKSVEEVRLDSETGSEFISASEDSLQVDLYDNLSIDLNMNITNAFSIRNRRFLDMQIDLTGELDMVKEANKPLEIFGVLDAENGYARPLGKNFNLEEGSITFDGNPENPLLNITTKYRPPQPADITIFYKITGRADKPTFVYESIPEMDKKNILSYTLFGQPFYGIDSWKQVVASPEGSNSAVTDLALNVMLDRVETLATQRLGIDVVQIDNTQTNTRSSTTLKTGWYLNEKTFFAVLNELSGSSPETQFLLEYLINNNLKLILTQGQNNRTGIDISWQYDY